MSPIVFDLPRIVAHKSRGEQLGEPKRSRRPRVRDGFLGRAGPGNSSAKFWEERKRERKVGRQEEKGRRKKGKKEETRSPEAEREGVTTAALSITIFTTRRNLRDLNILCGGLAQALHNHSRSLGCIIMHEDGTAWVSRARYVCNVCARAAYAGLQAPPERVRAALGLKLIRALGTTWFSPSTRAATTGAVERAWPGFLSNYTSTRHTSPCLPSRGVTPLNQGPLYADFCSASPRRIIGWYFWRWLLQLSARRMDVSLVREVRTENARSERRCWITTNWNNRGCDKYIFPGNAGEKACVISRARGGSPKRENQCPRNVITKLRSRQSGEFRASDRIHAGQLSERRIVVGGYHHPLACRAWKCDDVTLRRKRRLSARIGNWKALSRKAATIEAAGTERGGEGHLHVSLHGSSRSVSLYSASESFVRSWGCLLAAASPPSSEKRTFRA